MKRSPMKRTARRTRPRLTHDTASAAWERFGGHCACGCGRRADEWHHIFDQQRFPELVDEIDNIVAVARRCHEQHTQRTKLFARRVCRFAERLAVTPRMQDYLDRNYDGSN